MNFIRMGMPACIVQGLLRYSIDGQFFVRVQAIRKVIDKKLNLQIQLALEFIEQVPE